MIAPIGITVGYLAKIIFTPKYISQSRTLLVVTIVALTGSLLVIVAPPKIYFVDNFSSHLVAH